jgi:hypothetical protein
MAFAFSVHPKPPRLEDGKGKAKAENPPAGRIFGFGLNLLPKPGSPERSDGNPKA